MAADGGDALPREFFPGAPVAETYPLVVAVTNDGTEVDYQRWFEDGYENRGNRIGRRKGAVFATAFRFEVALLAASESVAFARLVLPALGDGQVNASVKLRIVGIAEDGIGPFNKRRPSQLRQTAAEVEWVVPDKWPGRLDKERSYCVPFRRYTPNLAPVLNEILSRPQWWKGSFGKTIGFVIEAVGAGGDDLQQSSSASTRDTLGMERPTSEHVNPDSNFEAIEDSASARSRCKSDQSAKLEIYPTLRSTFVGKELLGRVSAQSVTINLHSLLPVDLYFEIGRESGNYTRQTKVHSFDAGEEIEQRLSGLTANARYYYRTRFRRRGSGDFAAGPEASFHTQRVPGSTFTFALQSDAHLQGLYKDNRRRGLAIYRQTLGNILASQPDFMLDLGDTFHSQFFAGRDSRDFDEAFHRHLDHRAFFDRVGHSVPVFFVMGNHEGEQGWKLDGTPDNVAVWATRARKILYANPSPDEFFSGDNTQYPFVGRRESIYAWQWGDALFVVLDPFWSTSVNPHGATADPWAWTIGRPQYEWLRHTLETSKARFKLVFIHHLTGGLEPAKPYGRGGIRAVRHDMGGEGSYEWGGEDLDGTYAFDRKRPGWGMPIHQLMVDNNVAALFHGHDHCYAREILDHIAYQEVPVPSDAGFGLGFCKGTRFYGGADVRRNTGHLRVTVAPDAMTVEYVRAFLDERNGTVAASYTLSDCNRNGVVDSKDIASSPQLDANQDGRIDACATQEAYER